jgi:type IV pilus assembly protein PilQ
MKRTNWFTQYGMFICLVLVVILVFGDVAGAQAVPAKGDTGVPAGAGVEKPTTAPVAKPADEKVGGAVTDEMFTGKWSDADVRVVLRQLSVMFGANIVASKGVSGRVTVSLYDLTFDETLTAILKSSGLAHVKDGKFIYIYTVEELAAIKAASLKMEVRTFKLDYITAADAQLLIKPAMSAEASIAVTPIPETGITANASVAGDNSHATSGVLVISDFPENIKRIAEIIAEIDVRPQQVLVESTILSAELTENNRLGVNFDILANTDYTTQGVAGFFDGTTGDLINTPADNRAITTVGTDFTRVTGGVTFGFLTDSVAVFLQALEVITDVTVLANPKLLVVNRQKGEVIVGQKEGYVTTVVSDGVATQSVEFLETGTRLIVRPYIGRDGYIRMMIHPEDSTGGTTVDGTFLIPRSETAEVTSNVLVRDGRTIVIGGLFREDTTNSRSQVPVIGSIPYLGTLFGATTDTTVRRELMVLMTPHIVKQEEFEDVSANIKDDLERFRVGARKGMQWWAADRLARSHLNWAREHLKNGRLDRARWDLDMALARRPSLPEAIEMRENLTNKAYWAEEARQSAIRTVIDRMLMHEMGKDFRKAVPPLKPRNYILPVRKGTKPAAKAVVPKKPTTRPSGKKKAKVAKVSKVSKK